VAALTGRPESLEAAPRAPRDARGAAFCTDAGGGPARRPATLSGSHQTRGVAHEGVALASALVATALSLGLVPAAAHAQEFSFDAFVGTWDGTITSDWGGYSDPITLVVHADGFYTDSSGHLTSDNHPGTEVCHYDVPSNRVRFRYLSVIRDGRELYTNIWHEVVQFTGDTLLLEYDSEDIDQTFPEVQNLVPTRVSGAVTAVGAGDGDGAPDATRLGLTAYPNPFNPATRVAFALAASGPATVEIVDLRGRRAAMPRPVAASGHLTSSTFVRSTRSPARRRSRYVPLACGRPAPSRPSQVTRCSPAARRSPASSDRTWRPRRS